MSNLKITPGSSFIEDVGAIASQKENFGIDIEDVVVILEGPSDALVIQKYFYFKSKHLPIRLALAEGFKEKSAGKKNALISYEKYKNDIEDLYCLLDRDYDFFLGTNKEDSNIFYYDYFELENHLFEGPILKILFDTFYDCKDESMFQQLKEQLSVMRDTLEIVSRICYFREIYYHRKTEIILTPIQLKTIVELCNPNYREIFLSKKTYGANVSFKKRLELYIVEELKKVDFDIEIILKETEHLIQTDYMEFLKRHFSGKDLATLFTTFVDHCFPIKKNSSGSRGLNEILLSQWLPTQSKKLEELLMRFEGKL